MHKVIVINLNGNAYQLDELGYDAVRAYLDRAEAQLRTSPDLAEIMADLEQAIAEKCQRFLGPHKTVVSAAEIDQIRGDSPSSGGRRRVRPERSAARQSRAARIGRDNRNRRAGRCIDR
jgi:predicted exporter